MVRTVDQYGAPSFGPLGRPVAGFIFHTPENVDPTLAQAIAVAKWQATSANTSRGSYHGILGHDSVRFTDNLYTCTNKDHWVMVRSVPWNMACGGVTTSRDPLVWGPERYPWMQQLVHAAAFDDPNKYFHQIAISGKASQFEQNGYPPGAVEAIAEWVKILEGAYSYDAVLTLHRFWQKNRTDPGPVNFADLVLAAYDRQNAPAPAPTPPPPPPVNPLQAVVDSKNQKIDQAIAILQDARND